MKRGYVISGAIVVVALIAAAGWWHFAGSAGKADAAPPAADDTSVLVKTQTVRQQLLPITLDTFGELATGKPLALSFPQAGQVLRLAVVLGQKVRRGDPIATLVSDPVAVSNYTQAANAVAFAQRELQRNLDLFELQLATQSQVDAARKQLADAQAALAAQLKTGGGRANAQLNAPFDGIVVALPVGQGDRVAPGATVAQLGPTDRLRALLAIEPARGGQVKAGMPVSITPVQDEAGTIDARISEVEDLIDPKSQMVTAIAGLPPKAQARLVSGMRVQAAIRLGVRQGWAVPRQAVLSDDKGAYLFQVKEQRAHRVDVTKLAETGQLYGVAGPIDPALPVVVLGNYELRDGMRVREGTQ